MGPGRCVCPFISIPGAPPWVTVTPPSGRDVPGDSCWPWSGRSPALIVPLKQAGQSPVSSQPAAWALPGQGQGPECQLAVPERRLRFPASGRERALPKRAGSGSPCPGHGPVCTRRRPRLLSGRRGVSGCRPGAPASAGRVTVDTVVGTGDVGSLVSPRVRAGTSAGSALLTGRGGRRNPRAVLRAPPHHRCPILGFISSYKLLGHGGLILCCPARGSSDECARRVFKRGAAGGGHTAQARPVGAPESYTRLRTWLWGPEHVDMIHPS